MLSNSLLKSEFEKWRQLLAKAKKPLPTRRECVKMYEAMQYMKNYRFTEVRSSCDGVFFLSTCAAGGHQSVSAKEAAEDI